MSLLILRRGTPLPQEKTPSRLKITQPASTQTRRARALTPVSKMMTM